MNPTDHHDGNDGNEKLNFIQDFYISMVLGFNVGFWGVCGSLLVQQRNLEDMVMSSSLMICTTNCMCYIKEGSKLC